MFLYYKREKLEAIGWERQKGEMKNMGLGA
jgi:hypothetical protein